MKILFLSRWFPYPPNNGSKIRIFNLLRGLAVYHDVVLLSFADQPVEFNDAELVRSLCSELYIVPWQEFNPQSLRSKMAFLSLKPRSVVDTFSLVMAQTIEDVIGQHKIELVIASQYHMAAYYPYFGNVPSIFEEMEIGLNYKVISSAVITKKRIRSYLTWLKLHLYLSRILKYYRAVTVVSEQERQLFMRNFPVYKKRVEIIPNCVDYGTYQEYHEKPKENQLIFTGSFKYYPNYEAILWFIQNVYPLVLERMPNIHLVITGDHANYQLPLTNNITLTGHVDNVRELIASSMVSIVPIWSGGGTRLKVLEAMALGTPVVSTSKGIEGLEVNSGEHLLIADTPVEFARCILRILLEKDFSHALAENAKSLIDANYDWAVIMPRFLSLLQET